MPPGTPLAGRRQAVTTQTPDVHLDPHPRWISIDERQDPLAGSGSSPLPARAAMASQRQQSSATSRGSRWTDRRVGLTTPTWPDRPVTRDAEVIGAVGRLHHRDGPRLQAQRGVGVVVHEHLVADLQGVPLEPQHG